MAKNERGVYEPPSDKIRVYDGDDDDLDEEGSRLPLLIVIALLVLAAFGGVVWLAYTQGVQRGRDGGPRIIDAEQGPVKTAPANPGGATPYKGLKIYEQPAPSDDESDAAESGQQAAPVAPPVAKPEAKAPPPVAKPAPAVSKPALAAIAPPPAKTAAPKQAEAPKAVVAKAESTPKPVVAKAEAAPKAAPAVSAPAKAAAGGTYVLQIGAYKSEADAKSAWAAYKRKHPMADSFAPDIKRVDLGDKGTWYRLRMGSFPNRTVAGALCDRLKAEGAGCFPAAY